MKFISTILLFLIVSGVWAQSPKLERSLKEVTFSRRGYELGFQHGKLLKIEIDDLVTKWKMNTTKAFGKDADIILKEFFKYANFTDAIKKWTPDLFKEIEGIANGSKQRFNDILVLNLLDEFWVYIDQLYNHHCTDIGVASIHGSPSYVAQNMDIESYTDGYQTLVRLEKTNESPEQLILTHPGLIALNGMNETGVGVVVNTIMQLSASTAGLPVAFIVRKIIDSTDKDDLLEFLTSVNHASGQNYIVGIRGEVFDFEASANQVIQYNPKNENGTVYHTNHPIVNNDLKPWYNQFNPNLEADEKPHSNNSYIRLSAVKKHVIDKMKITEEDIKNALRSKDDTMNPVCRSNQNNGRVFTFASTIMSLSGKPYLKITAGPPDESEYKRIDFTSE
ncbi:C45 family autoproteolytic acyltransferase/hydolase [Changchengzhania lutea]|uniref:C45 family autoproteolytic acyltransferase/hydolase n=1 Tax=Changchengzhania lutea TaxID=2049305 RepID=UPI00115F08F2|nr:C45 family peptidase [Changchengzhania lutea]